MICATCNCEIVELEEFTVNDGHTYHYLQARCIELLRAENERLRAENVKLYILLAESERKWLEQRR